MASIYVSCKYLSKLLLSSLFVHSQHLQPEKKQINNFSYISDNCQSMLAMPWRNARNKTNDCNNSELDMSLQRVFGVEATSVKKSKREKSKQKRKVHEAWEDISVYLYCSNVWRHIIKMTLNSNSINRYASILEEFSLIPVCLENTQSSIKTIYELHKIVWNYITYHLTIQTLKYLKK